MYLILPLLFIASCVIADVTDDKAYSRMFKNIERCTRRFSPGKCKSPVQAVWTFSYMDGNCTERLGCTTVTRSNRFTTLKRCRDMCSSVFVALQHTDREREIDKLLSLSAQWKEPDPNDADYQQYQEPPAGDSSAEPWDYDAGRGLQREDYD